MVEWMMKIGAFMTLFVTLPIVMAWIIYYFTREEQTWI